MRTLCVYNIYIYIYIYIHTHIYIYIYIYIYSKARCCFRVKHEDPKQKVRAIITIKQIKCVNRS